MNFSIVLILSIFVSIGESQTASRVPAMVVRVTRDALDTVSQAVSTILPKSVMNTTLPDFDLSVSKTKIDLKNMGVKNFSSPFVNYTLLAPNKINFDLITGPIDVLADWFAEKPTFFSTYYDKGLLKVHMEDFRATINMEIGEPSKNGIPSISAAGCTATIGKANLIIKGATQQFFIDIIQTFSLILKSVLQTQMCSIVQSMVASQINARLQSVPDILKFHPDLSLKFIMQPLVTTDYIEISVKAFMEKVKAPDVATTMGVMTTAAVGNKTTMGMTGVTGSSTTVKP